MGESTYWYAGIHRNPKGNPLTRFIFADLLLLTRDSLHIIHGVTKDTPTDFSNNVLTNRTPLLPTKRGFKMPSLDTISLTKHIDELRILLANYPLDVISINETRLDEGILNSDIYIPGYEIVRRSSIIIEVTRSFDLIISIIIWIIQSRI